MIYLDHAASTPTSSLANNLLKNLWASEYANPTATHRKGREGAELINQARQEILSVLSDSTGNLIFTSSATESNNTILQGVSLSRGDEVIFSPADHPSITKPLMRLAGRLGIKLIKIALDGDGRVDQEGFEQQLSEKVRLVVLTQVNNSSGHIYPVSELAKIVKGINSKVHLHVDAAQSFTKLPLDLSDHLIDSVAISAHKMGGPCGISALYYRSGVEFSPLLWGGGQESGLRSSTPATVLIAAFAAAVKEANLKCQQEFQRVQELSNQVRDILSGELGERVIFPFLGSDISPYIVTMLFPGLAGDMLLRYLERDEIYLSSTSACSAPSRGTNPVLAYLGVEERWHNSVLRCSFGASSSQQEVTTFCSHLLQNHRRLFSLMAR
ncbi:MAG: aminotransferase class V-fold PLP-dependent enzyme [Bdellovibrionales bacterium]|jgi:cysteine desulfurase|nr:aminotransferase class V-fold PLP-dependent enzyme [Bdellovibrionales bacterium]MBT3525194.1 aminotransferase class V-fold PLP-dependent enzyme [Bdellovibrionales bacterium]MBT7668673.1 aminotransferase class V-fold PLP-dependent enzyme [Bdellovibrionales bacterium]MBT7766549.1 aminotransferase class V-fold PLP-dependent enzyme [Bdellovibrionales bacterium]